MAKKAELARDVESAAQAWRWTACAYHAASLGFHFGPEDLRGKRESFADARWRTLPIAGGSE